MTWCYLIFLGLIGLSHCCSDFVFLIDTEVDDNPLGRGLQVGGFTDSSEIGFYGGSQNRRLCKEMFF